MQSTHNILAQLSGLRLSDGTTAGERIKMKATPPSVAPSAKAGGGAATFSAAPPPRSAQTSASAAGSSVASPAPSDAVRGGARGSGSSSRQPPAAASAAPNKDAAACVTIKTKDGATVALPKPRSEGKSSHASTSPAVVVPSGQDELSPTVLEFFQKSGAGADKSVRLSSVPAAAPSGATKAPKAAAAATTSAADGRPARGGGAAAAPSTIPTAEERRAALAASPFLLDAFGAVDNSGADRPIVRSLPRVAEGGRYIIVGDIHGCVDQLEALVEKVKYEKGKDCLVMIGDYVNKGPDSIGVVRACMRLGALGVLGNHDYTLLKCIARKRRRAFRPEELKDPVKQLAKIFPLECEYYLRGLPHILKLPEYNVLLVHAGLNIQHKQLEDQDVVEIMHMRRLEKVVTPHPQHHSKDVTKYLAVVKGQAGVPWGELWEGPEQVIFGHDAYSGFQSHPKATGIDTGCVYGDPLTCVVFGPSHPQGEFYTVPGLPKSTNELKGLPPPSSAIYEQVQEELEKQIIRPTPRSTPLTAGSPSSSHPTFATTPVSQPARALMATKTSTNERLTPSSMFPTSRIMTPTSLTASNVMNEVADASAREVQKATLLALSAAKEISALAVVMSIPVFESSLELMQQADESDKIALESFWVPLVRNILEAGEKHLAGAGVRAAIIAETSSGAPSNLSSESEMRVEETLLYAFGVCDEIDDVRAAVMTQLRALREPSIEAKLSKAARKYLSVLLS